MDAGWTTTEDITILTIAPHMHRLGTEMRISATIPSRISETLLWVRGYDEDRQKAYTFTTPKILPKGSRIDVTGYYNNSDSNTKLTFVPPQVVRWGPSAAHEMLTAFLEYVDGVL